MMEKTTSIPNTIGWPTRIAESNVILNDENLVRCGFNTLINLWHGLQGCGKGRRARVMAGRKIDRLVSASCNEMQSVLQGGGLFQFRLWLVI